jgi:2'-5' RNA ligase
VTNPEASQRLFVAIELPEAWKEGLESLQEHMRAALRARFGDAVRPRWVRPESIHLTLKFLGATLPSRLAAIEEALRLAVPDAPGLTLSLGRAGSFAERRAPRVILATVAGETERLGQLATRIETRLAAAGWPRERRSFHPHLTLARMPDGIEDATRRLVAEVTGACPPPSVPAFRVDHVSLMRSHLGPGGARHERLAAYPVDATP